MTKREALRQAQQEHTRHTLSDLIQQHWESDLPDQIIEALRPLNGKMITTRLLDKLPGGKEAWILSRNYGWTELDSRTYRSSQGNKGVHLILARSEASVPLDLAVVESENPAYFDARRKRNHARMEARNDGGRLDALAATMNRIESLQAQLDSAVSDFDALTEYGTVFHQDMYTLRKACGLDKK
jgi:hypothetical protein